jgi:predicted acetyltransferase
LAEDGNSNYHAAIYLIWDRDCTYYLMGGADPEFRNSGAMSLLIWEGINQAAQRKQSFDFEGSMIEPIEHFFRSFGGEQTHYLQITKRSRKGKFIKLLSEFKKLAFGNA